MNNKWKVKKTGDKGKTGDPGLDGLNALIDASLAEPNQRKRVAITDKRYKIQLYVDGLNGSLIPDRIITIPAGHRVYLLRSEGSDSTDRNQFLVTEGDHGWRIMPASGRVKYFDNPIYVMHDRDHTMPIASVKFNGDGLSLR